MSLSTRLLFCMTGILLQFAHDWVACPIGARDIASRWTQQKILLPVVLPLVSLCGMTYSILAWLFTAP